MLTQCGMRQWCCDHRSNGSFDGSLTVHGCSRALTFAFPFPLYTVAPEATPKDGATVKGTVDLLVRNVTTRAPWVFYEGKSATGDSLRVAQKQLEDYTKEANVKRVWGIAAKSTTACFFWVEFDLGFLRSFPLRVESHVVHRGIADGQPIHFKLSDDAQRQNAMTILQFMVNNDPTGKRVLCCSSVPDLINGYLFAGPSSLECCRTCASAVYNYLVNTFSPVI
jgi:hypothetical protein